MGRTSGARDDPWDWRGLTVVALEETRRMLRAPHDAEDAAQEAIIRAYRARERCKTPASPQAWVRTIARREALRFYGQRAPPAELPEAEAQAAPDHSELVLERLAAASLLRRVPVADRSLLVRRYVLDQNSSEIAEELALPAATVRVRLHRAVKRIHEQGPTDP
jgi:RNA polymerase sigma-70 factor (ECF subfamily)